MGKSGKILGLILAVQRLERFCSAISSVAQKINNTLETPLEVNLPWFDRVKDFVYDSTVGVLNDYKDRAEQYVKIKAVEVYARAVQAFHKQVLALAAVLGCAMVFSVALVVIPVAIVWTLPVGYGVKLGIYIAMATLFIAVPISVIVYFLSEERWMKFTKVQELVDSVTKE